MYTVLNNIVPKYFLEKIQVIMSMVLSVFDLLQIEFFQIWMQIKRMK